MTALKRKYYWIGMQRTVEEIVKDCVTCQTTKYDRHPPVGLQTETDTPLAPLTDLQIDTFTWRSFKWVTIIDILSKIAMAHPVKEKSAEAVSRALQTWFQVYGVPEVISSDGGREFNP
ncbi:hypothetical protein ACUWCL_28455, partial [Klebsiella pneumoniae]|uniref:hypothetical protein n=1 Tax=Klebsiella pneumoniae TaxID=573 RepID=UPI0040557A82